MSLRPTYLGRCRADDENYPHQPSEELVKHIRIDTDRDGVVWMSGTVNSQDEADKAVMIAHNTEGVRSVHSDLKVQKDR